MTTKQATLVLGLVDGVSKPARSVAEALKQAEKQALSVAKAMNGSGASDHFVASLSKLKLSAKDVEAVAAGMRDYAKAAGLAENASKWTGPQIADMRKWERATISTLREVSAEQGRYAKSVQTQMNKVKPATISVGAAASVGSIYAISKAEQFASEAVQTYRQYSDVNAIMRPVLDLSPAEQASLKAQQLELGIATRYSPVKIAEAQKLLGERGVNKSLIEPYVAEAVNYASAMNVELPEAIKTLEAYMFSTGKLKDVKDAAQAKLIMRKVTDYATHLSKISGLPDEEISAFFEYGGLSGHQVGLSDSTVGAMAALMKRNQISGEKAGVAMRAISAKLVSPTEKGLTALASMGINYDDFVHSPEGMTSEKLGLALKQTFGKRLSPAQAGAIDEKLADEDVVTSRGEFVQQLGEIIASSFVNKKGKISAVDSQKLAKFLGKFYGAAASGVDAEGLLHAIMKKHPTLEQLNSFFGFQQGSRAGAALQNESEFDEKKAQLDHTELGFAANIAAERLRSFDGAVKQLEGSMETLQVRMTESFDNHGRGDGALTEFTNALTAAANKVIQLPDGLLRLSTEAAALGGAFATLKTAGVLAGSVGLESLSTAASLAATALGPIAALAVAASVASEALRAMEDNRLTPKEPDKTYTSDFLLKMAKAMGADIPEGPDTDALMKRKEVVSGVREKEWESRRGHVLSNLPSPEAPEVERKTPEQIVRDRLRAWQEIYSPPERYMAYERRRARARAGAPENLEPPHSGPAPAVDHVQQGAEPVTRPEAATPSATPTAPTAAVVAPSKPTASSPTVASPSAPAAVDEFGRPITISVDASSIDAVGEKAKTAQSALGEIAKPIAAQVDTSSIDAAIAKARELKSLLTGLGVPGASAPTLGHTIRGGFSAQSSTLR